ncbi:3-oxoadipate enol-lactonase [Nocardia yamanashiensis]|uniref:3-oxoadipate enol-lactonase n=1 Tax=Nocardia yamanashiensis TaxID=209247 RepID=UPI001E4DF8DD|nr:3-oxoadipate enol-lactonase [Nocardia yamanashiensis]UGT41518.1 3-oxoadipate enol-lactonase [Nocardia yamanashiensis]
MSELFGPLQAAGPAAQATDDAAWLQALLDAEAGLAWAQADTGLIPLEHAAAIAAACRADLYDAAEIGRAATGIGNPAAPLVRALTARVADREAAGSVHLGATSQDIMDTAAMLVADRVIDACWDDVTACRTMLAGLAEQHMCTPQAGRSLLQQALPVTFGLTAAGWLSALESAADQLERIQRERLAVQLGGAVGTLAALGQAGPDVLSAYARRLDLPDPGLPWHTDRVRIAELAAALGTVASVVAKVARDITLLAQTEIGEVSEIAPGAGGSSTMPHKRNPIAAVGAAAAAARAPGLVATLLAVSAHEHQRAAGAWHAEWRPLNELLRCTGTAVHWLRTSLCRLRVHPRVMRRNLAGTGGLLMSEQVTAALTPVVGRLAAHDAVTACALRAADGSGDFADLLLTHPLLAPHLNRARVGALLEPSTYLGSARIFAERALAAHRRRGRDAAAEYAGADATGRHSGADVTHLGARCGAGESGRVDSGAAGRAVEVRAEVRGAAEGTPVVLLNALGSDMRIWDSYVRPLVDNGFRVIRFDARGHGDSPVPAGPYRVADLGADVEALLDWLGVESAHLVGVSLGGMTAMWLAAHRPHRVRGLVACCTSARPGNAAGWIERAAEARAEGMGEIAEASVARWFTPQWRAANPEITTRMRELTTDTPPEGYAACCEALAGLDLSAELARIGAPTLVLSTEQDPAFPPEHGRDIAARIPGARFESIDGAAHLGTVEQPERFLPLIIDQLRRIP